MRGNMFLHWLLYHLRVQNARTQVTPGEHAVLQRHASGKQCVVELGVFEGATSRLLRDVMAPAGNLWCIDPFPCGWLGFSYSYSIAEREVTKSRNGHASFIRQYSHNAVRDWHEPIDMLFIDADHSYEAVKRDWQTWSPHVVQGGVVSLHDSRVVKGRTDSETGPARLVKELLQSSCDFRSVDQVETLTVLERIQSKAGSCQSEVG